MRRFVLVVTIAASGCLPPPTWVAVAPDNTTVSVTTRGTLRCVRVGARHDGCYDGIATGSVTFARGGAHVAYAARMGDSWSIVRDGRAGQQWSGVSAPKFSADGSRLLYPAFDGDGWRIVSDSSTGELFEQVLRGSMVVDPSGRSVAYAARSGSATYVVVNGVRSQVWRSVGQIAFGADGSGPAYAAQDSLLWQVVIGGTRGPQFTRMHSLRVLPGAVPLYVAADDTSERVILGETLHRGHPTILQVDHHDDGSWGYLALDGDVPSVFVNGKARTASPFMHEIAVGANGRLVTLRDSGPDAVVDFEGQSFRFDLVIAGTLQFLPDGTRWVCLTGDRRRRRLTLIVNGTPIGETVEWKDVAAVVERGGEPALREWVAAAALARLSGEGRPSAGRR